MWAEPSTRTVPCSRSDMPTAVGGKAIGHRCVGPGGALLPDVHHHHTLPTDREDHRVASHSSSRAEEEARPVASSSRKALPTNTREQAPLPRRPHSLKLVISEEETVSKCRHFRTYTPSQREISS